MTRSTIAWVALWMVAIFGPTARGQTASGQTANGVALFGPAANEQLASGSTFNDHLVQAPELKAPERGSITGSLSGFALASDQLARGSFSLPSGIAFPSERGEPLMGLAPSYSPEVGLSEWGMGWSVSLSITRAPLLGDPRYDASDTFASPWGRLIRGTDGYFYPRGLATAMRFELTAADEWIAIAANGTRFVFSQRRAGRGGTYAWSLTRAQTLQGDAMSLVYSVNPSGRPFVHTATYGGRAAPDSYRVTFVYAPLAVSFPSYRSGRRVDLDRRVTSIEVDTRTPAGYQRRWTYTLGYESHPRSAVYYLRSIQRAFASGEVEPALTFAYDDGTETIATARLEHVKALDTYVNMAGTGGIQPNFATQLDIDRDGLIDFEHHYQQTTVRQQPSGWTFDPTPIAPDRDLRCRPKPSMGNEPRTLAIMRPSDTEARAFVASYVSWVTLHTNLFVCSRAGSMLHQQKVEGDWRLNAYTRLADVNRDLRPDLVQLNYGEVTVLANTSNDTGYAFELRASQALMPAFLAQSVWIHDINGDGIADLVARHYHGLTVWAGRGDYTFETQGREVDIFDSFGRAFTNLDSGGLWFVDANKDGLTDVFILFGPGQVALYLNDGEHMRYMDVPALETTRLLLSSPVTADLAGTGNSQVVYTSSAGGKNRVLALSFDTPSTGLLVRADDGKGTRVAFTYQRAGSEPGLGYRTSLLASSTVHTAGMEPVTVNYTFNGSIMHSTAKSLIGFGAAQRTSPFVVEDSTYSADDALSLTLTRRTTTDPRTPGVSRSDATELEIHAYQGVSFYRPRSQTKAWTGGGRSTSETTTTLYGSDLCGTDRTTVSPLGTLVRRTTLDRPARLIHGLHCLVATETVIGTHPDPALNFTESGKITRRDDGQIQQITVNGAQGPLVVQNLTYDALGRVYKFGAPGRGYTTVDYDGVTGLPQAITAPDGVVTRVEGREPLTSAMRTLRTDRGVGGVLRRFFRYDGFERLAREWDDLRGGSETNPLVSVKYTFADARHPGSITAEKLVTATPPVRSTDVELFTGDGKEFARYARTPEGWAALSMTTIEPAQLRTKNLVGSPLGSRQNPTLETFASLRTAATAIKTTEQAGFGHAARTTAVMQAGVVRDVATTLSVEGDALVTRTVENHVHTTSTAATASGVSMWSRDASGKRTDFVRDALERVRRVVLADGKTVQQLDYDAYGRPAHIARTEAGTIDRAYDPVSGLVRKIRYGDGTRDVRVVDVDYDVIGREKRRRHTLVATGETEIYTFDYDGGPNRHPGQLGQLSRVTGPDFTRDEIFDPASAVVQTSVAVAGWRTVEQKHRYRADGSVAETAVTLRDSATGAVLETVVKRHTVDEVGRAKSLYVGASRAFDARYDRRNRLFQVGYAGGTTTYTFDPVTRTTTGYARTGPAALSASWTLDHRGLIAREVTSVGATSWDRTYRYDPRRFLVEVLDAARATTDTYAYGATGLIDSMSDVHGARTLVRTPGAITVGTDVYALDPLGRVMAKPGARIVYAPNGQLDRAVLDNGTTIHYGYDENDQRILKRRNGAIHSARVGDIYVDASGMTEPVRIGDRLVGVIRGGAFQLVQADPRGSILANTDGTPRALSAYGARSLRPDLAEILDYAERGYDVDVGVVRMGVRDYDPLLGQFLSPDPLFLGSISECAGSPVDCNLYAYARANPISFIDPDGRNPVLLGFGLLALLTLENDRQADLTPVILSGFAAGGKLVAYAAAAFGLSQIKNDAEDSSLEPFLFAAGTRTVRAVSPRTGTAGSAKGSNKGVCFVAGTAVRTPPGVVSIERLRVGDRVATLPGGQATKVDSTWRVARLTMADEEEPSHLFEIDVLRPSEWFQKNQVDSPNDSVFLGLEEMGVSGWGIVKEIRTGLQVRDGRGRVVLTTISSLSNDVYELSFVEGEARLRGTGSHPLYSLDRDAWVRVRDLQVGERLQTEEGAVTIAALEKIRGVHRVYNLEVEGDHEYLVGQARVRAHNKGIRPGSPGACFPAGTMVSTDTGLRPIEDVSEGELVECAKPGDEDDQLCEVESLIRHDYAGDLVTITTTTEVIKATGGHPFWIISGSGLGGRPSVEDVGEKRLVQDGGGRWVAARDLRHGDELLALGSEEPIFVKEVAVRDAELAVFNLTVEGLHTYEVGSSGVLVHNKAMRATGLWKSVKRFGHTFKTHGAGAKNTRSLMDRARSTGKPQGQWLDNDSAATFLSDLDIQRPVSIRIPEGLGQVIRPNGSVVQATWAKVIPGPHGIRTAFPILP